MFNKCLSLCLGAIGLFTISAAAHPPSDLADLVGARAPGGDTALQYRGYADMGHHGLTAYWWSDEAEICVRVLTADGRYQAVDIVRPRNCGMAGNKADPGGHKASPSQMRESCDGAVTGKFSSEVAHVEMPNVQSVDDGWGVYGTAFLRNGNTASFACMFDSAGKFRHINASQPNSYAPVGCPPYVSDYVSEADRFAYPDCN